ncbi:ApaG domain, partial [bacterium]|nr:ApaG domain [bacterium]
ICQANNEWIVVEGDGVVNQEPVIKPGDEFTYNSYHVIGDDSRATGSFFGEAEDGSLVMVRIPDFELKIPQWAEKS